MLIMSIVATCVRTQERVNVGRVYRDLGGDPATPTPEDIPLEPYPIGRGRERKKCGGRKEDGKLKMEERRGRRIR